MKAARRNNLKAGFVCQSRRCGEGQEARSLPWCCITSPGALGQKCCRCLRCYLLQRSLISSEQGTSSLTLSCIGKESQRTMLIKLGHQNSVLSKAAFSVCMFPSLSLSLQVLLMLSCSTSCNYSVRNIPDTFTFTEEVPLFCIESSLFSPCNVQWDIVILIK